MPLSMYQLSTPAFVRALGSLRALLEKGAAHAEAHKIEPQALVGFRLFPDMLPLSAQVQIACDMAKGCVARLSGVTAPRFEDTEQTFPELCERIDKTLAFIRGVPAAQIDGTETKAVVMKTGRGDLNFDGQGYLLGFVLPNIHFHCTTAYNILRHNGVVIGKTDYLGKA